jgi:hypothetical protein
MKEKLEHAFKAGRISENTTFEEWYKTFEEGKAEEVYIKWQKMAVERGVLLNEIWKLTQAENYTPAAVLGAICLKMSEKEDVW